MRGTMRAAQYNTVCITAVQTNFDPLVDGPGILVCFAEHFTFQVNNKVEVNEVHIPEPGEYDILIKNVCATLCHSDLVRHLYIP